MWLKTRAVRHSLWVVECMACALSPMKRHGNVFHYRVLMENHPHNSQSKFFSSLLALSSLSISGLLLNVTLWTPPQHNRRIMTQDIFYRISLQCSLISGAKLSEGLSILWGFPNIENNVSKRDHMYVKREASHKNVNGNVTYFWPIISA